MPIILRPQVRGVSSGISRELRISWNEEAPHHCVTKISGYHIPARYLYQPEPTFFVGPL